MRRRSLCCLLFFALFSIPTSSAEADNRYIVRDSSGLGALDNLCLLLGCTVQGGLDGSLGALFLVTTPDTVDPNLFLQTLRSQPQISDAELDQLLHVMQSTAGTAPSGLTDATAVNYYGVSVWNGYASQPAVSIVRLSDAQAAFSVTGAGTVAVIDTGVDPTQPVLQGVLVPGFDFTRNQHGGSELGDVNQSTAAVLDNAAPTQVNQAAVAVINQSVAAVLDNSSYSAFGHGTMVSGIIHLVAPTAAIMPLKAFNANGSGYLSDVLRAIYYATQNGANVLNMSFDFAAYSQELSQAVDYAADKGVVPVASVGNDGLPMFVYPAGFRDVLGVASTSNIDTLSSFSNFGEPPVWLGAPGEGIITTYPYGTYAAGWGTSFSAPFVSGAVALLRSVNSNVNPSLAKQALAHAVFVSTQVGNGRLDVYQAVAALY